MLVTFEASAGPFHETLAKQAIEAIVKAIQAALPKVDQAAAKQCEPTLDAYNKDPEGNLDKLGTGAACFRAAGSLAAAIQLWRTVEQYDRNATRKRDAIRSLASAYETAASSLRRPRMARSTPPSTGARPMLPISCRARSAFAVSSAKPTTPSAT